MSTSGNGLPPLPKPPSGLQTETIQLTLPGDLLRDLKTAAQDQKLDLDTAVAMCVQLWRYPPQQGASRSSPKRRAKRA